MALSAFCSSLVGHDPFASRRLSLNQLTMKVQSLALLPWLCGLVVSQKTMDYTPWAPVDPRDPTPPVVSPLECQKALHETGMTAPRPDDGRWLVTWEILC